MFSLVILAPLPFYWSSCFVGFPQFVSTFVGALLFVFLVAPSSSRYLRHFRSKVRFSLISSSLVLFISTSPPLRLFLVFSQNVLLVFFSLFCHFSPKFSLGYCLRLFFPSSSLISLHLCVFLVKSYLLRLPLRVPPKSSSRWLPLEKGSLLPLLRPPRTMRKGNLASQRNWKWLSSNPLIPVALLTKAFFNCFRTWDGKTFYIWEGQPVYLQQISCMRPYQMRTLRLALLKSLIETKSSHLFLVLSRSIILNVPCANEGNNPFNPHMSEEECLQITHFLCDE